MSALPSLHASVDYILTHCDLDIRNSRCETEGNGGMVQAVLQTTATGEEGKARLSGTCERAATKARTCVPLLDPRSEALTGCAPVRSSTSCSAYISDPPSKALAMVRIRYINIPTSDLTLNPQPDAGRSRTKHTWRVEDGIFGGGCFILSRNRERENLW